MRFQKRWNAISVDRDSAFGLEKNTSSSEKGIKKEQVPENKENFRGGGLQTQGWLEVEETVDEGLVTKDLSGKTQWLVRLSG